MSARLDPWPPSDARLNELRKRLLASARGGTASIPSEDAEDVVQSALLRLVREKPRDGAPPDHVRAHQALRRERANFYRTRDRHPEDPTDEPTPLHAGGTGPDARFIEAALAIEQIAGRDARLLAAVRGERHSYEDCAALLGWSIQRVDAARKQLERHKPHIAAALEIHLRETTNGS